MPNTFSLKANFEASPPSPYEGGVCCSIDDTQVVTPAGEATAVLMCLDLTIAASSTATVSPHAGLDVFGNAAGMTNVQVLDIKCDPANTGSVSVSPSAVNGWTNLIPSGSLKIEAGAGMDIRSLATGYPVDPANHELTLTNNDASNSAHVTVLILGYSGLL